MKLHKSLFILLIVLAAGCSPQKEVVHDQILVHDGGASQMGGTDSAGGNGIQGKPLESYRFDINALPDFQPVQSIIKQVLRTFPELAGDMWHISQDRRWYKVPVSLDLIPSERIGVAFKTDQLALQNLGEIWIDDTSFSGVMGPEDRSLLVLHEIVMGVRLMSFQDDFDKCLAKTSASELSAKTAADKAGYEKDRKTCYEQYSRLGVPANPLPIPGGDNISLSKEDYENIRYLVTELWSTEGKVDGEELRDWMKAKGFGNF